MKRIGIYFFCVVALGCVTSSILYRRSEEANEIRLEKSASERIESETENVNRTEIGANESEEYHSDASKETVEVSDGYVASEAERFLVKEEDGYLVIYDRMTMKRFDETTIRIADLPERLQDKVTEGLYFTDEEELYAFLENYSS